MLLQRELGIGFVLIISSSIRDSILLGELVLMSFLLIVAVFNTLSACIIVESGPPQAFWIVIFANPFLCTCG
tara:strand:+ start:198 stop:413 length:216 start_codon:yes stop_codon:yes gene_type:complete